VKERSEERPGQIAFIAGRVCDGQFMSRNACTLGQLTMQRGRLNIDVS
jgi:hypothetical protein